MADAAEFNTIIDTEDHTGNALPDDQRTEASDAVKQGQADAKANTKAEQKENSSVPNLSLTDADQNLADARETAELNHKVDVANQPDQYKIAANDTSKAGKVRATKAQLNPAGDEKISNAEITRAATNGTKVKGGTGLTNEEVAERAKNPGEAEEQSGNSIAGEGVDDSHLEVSDEVKHANSNETAETGEGGIARELAGPQNQSGPNADPAKTDTQADKS